jgi:hypothetical protein
MAELDRSFDYRSPIAPNSPQSQLDNGPIQPFENYIDIDSVVMAELDRSFSPGSFNCSSPTTHG